MSALKFCGMFVCSDNQSATLLFPVRVMRRVGLWTNVVTNSLARKLRTSWPMKIVIKC